MPVIVAKMGGKFLLLDGTRRLVELPTDNEDDNRIAFDALMEGLNACWTYRSIDQWREAYGPLVVKMGEPWLTRLKMIRDERYRAADNLINKQIREERSK